MFQNNFVGGIKSKVDIFEEGHIFPQFFKEKNEVFLAYICFNNQNTITEDLSFN